MGRIRRILIWLFAVLLLPVGCTQNKPGFVVLDTEHLPDGFVLETFMNGSDGPEGRTIYAQSADLRSPLYGFVSLTIYFADPAFEDPCPNPSCLEIAGHQVAKRTDTIFEWATTYEGEDIKIEVLSIEPAPGQIEAVVEGLRWTRIDALEDQ